MARGGYLPSCKVQATDSEVKSCSQIIKHEKMSSTHLILQKKERQRTMSFRLVTSVRQIKYSEYP